MSELKVCYFQLNPAPRNNEILELYLDSDPKAIVIGAYASGSIPDKLIPYIEKGTEDGIAMFSIRQSIDDKWVPEWSEDGSIILPGIYKEEYEGILKGMIPLQKDLVRFDEVMDGLNQICESHDNYDEIVREAMKRYSSNEWNVQINRIRKKHSLPELI